MPSFKNTHRAIQDALEYGVKVSDITTHIIDEEIDGGIILFQKPILFAKDDTSYSLIKKFQNVAPVIYMNTFDLIVENHHLKIIFTS